jgi:hypothetical protein
MPSTLSIEHLRLRAMVLAARPDYLPLLRSALVDCLWKVCAAVGRRRRPAIRISAEIQTRLVQAKQLHIAAKVEVEQQAQDGTA